MLSKREKYGIISGILGIILNVVLAVFKLVFGILSSSIALTADAINNLTDAVSNVITIIGSIISAKPVDKEHPFGHGRIEYVSALILSFLILLTAFELGKSSVERIISPTEISFDLLLLTVPISSICVKLFMAIFNKKLYLKCNNINLKAVSRDSLNDCLATFGTIIALVLTKYTSLLWVDGVIGLAVALFIALSGFGIVKETVSPLLGQAPPQELVNRIEEIIKEEEYIVGVHDLIIHSYGSDKIIASAHAEMPISVNLKKLHDCIDRAEKRIESELGVLICIHLDPVDLSDKDRKMYMQLSENIVKNYDDKYSFHDFNISVKKERTLIEFELVVPFDEKKESEQIIRELKELFRLADEKIELIITVEHNYV